MRFSETKIEKITLTDGLVRDLHIWEPEKPKSILFCIHGGLAHGGDYQGIGLHFKELGFTTIAPDLRGHIQKRSHFMDFMQIVDDMMDVFDWIQKYSDLPIIIVGHSVGSVLSTFLDNRLGINEQVKGYILSSPFYDNAIKVSPVLVALSGFLGKIMSKSKLPAPSLTDQLTHDKEITKRHHLDEKDEIRGTEGSMRFGAELLRSQKLVKKIIPDFKNKVLFLIASKDEVANSEETLKLISSINKELIEVIEYENNYHENFNELNRSDVFKDMLTWIEKVM